MKINYQLLFSEIPECCFAFREMKYHIIGTDLVQAPEIFMVILALPNFTDTVKWFEITITYWFLRLTDTIQIALQNSEFLFQNNFKILKIFFCISGNSLFC